MSKRKVAKKQPKPKAPTPSQQLQSLREQHLSLQMKYHDMEKRATNLAKRLSDSECENSSLCDSMNTLNNEFHKCHKILTDAGEVFGQPLSEDYVLGRARLGDSNAPLSIRLAYYVGTNNGN